MLQVCADHFMVRIN